LVLVQAAVAHDPGLQERPSARADEVGGRVVEVVEAVAYSLDVRSVMADQVTAAT